MNNRPYLAESANVYNQQSHKIEPAMYGNQNLLLNQAEQRTMCDRTTTSLANNPQQLIPESNFLLHAASSQPPQKIQGQMQLIPEGVRYTFHPQVQNYALKNFGDSTGFQQQGSNQSPQLTLHQQIAVNQLEKNTLECLLLQEKMKQNPFQLQFHRDGQTDTKDLEPLCLCCDSQCSKTVPTSLSPFKVVNRNSFEEAEKIDIYAQKDRPPNKIFLDSCTQKRLNLESEIKTQSVQSAPLHNSPEVLCNCIDTKEFSTVQCQTERKVTFNDVKHCMTNRPGKKKGDRKKVTHRAVDDGSSDESSDSSNSKDSNESND